MNDQQLVSDWLAECRADKTRVAYANRIKIFQAWYRKPLSQFLRLKPKEMRHLAITYQNEALQKQSMKPNSVSSVLSALGSFCMANDVPLSLRGKRVHVQMDIDSHNFTTPDLAKMFEVANTEEKAILASLCSLGWERSSLLELGRQRLESLVVKAKEQKKDFVYFLDQRKKTGACRLGILNPLALEWLDAWFKTRAILVQKVQGNYNKAVAKFGANSLETKEVKNLKLIQSDTIFAIATGDGMNKMLKRLTRQTHVTVTGRVHTHSIRKWVMSGLSHAGFNEFQIKFVVGKAIPASDATYLLTLQQEVEEKYPKAYESYLKIHGEPISEPRLSKEKLAKIEKLLDMMEKGKVIFTE